MFRYCFLLSILFCSSVLAQTPAGKTSVDSLFWRITSPDGKVESYLLGSVHILEKKDFLITDSFKVCFDRSSILITEVNMKEKSAIANSYDKIMLPKGTTIRDYVSMKELMRLDTIWRRLKFNEFEIMSFKMMKPIFWAGLVLNKLLEQPHEGYDMYFTEKAIAAQKNIIGLESIEFAMQQIDSIPLKEQYRSFLVDMKNMKQARKEMQTLSRVYRKRNITQLTKLIHEGITDMEGGEKHLLQERNNHWMSALQTNLPTQSCFVVVGAAHLFGNNGLLYLLQNKGYRLQPFPRNF